MEQQVLDADDLGQPSRLLGPRLLDHDVAHQRRLHTALVLELCLSRGGYFVTAGDTLPRDLAHAVEVYGIDDAAIQKAVADELETKRAARRVKSNSAAPA